MKPSQVRSQILGDHERLRGLLVPLERRGRRVLEGEEGELPLLRADAEAFLVRLREHMGWEDRYLRPALIGADARGQERARRLDDDHREQRELLEFVLRVVGDRTRPPVVIARNVLDLIELIRNDMVEEEYWLVNDRVLRDDGVGIDVESG